MFTGVPTPTKECAHFVLSTSQQSRCRLQNEQKEKKEGEREKQKKKKERDEQKRTKKTRQRNPLWLAEAAEKIYEKYQCYIRPEATRKGRPEITMA